MNFPRFPDHSMVTLLDGRLVFDDSPDAVHEREAKAIAQQPQEAREARLFDIEREQGVEASKRMRTTVDEVIAVVAARVA